MIGIDEVGRGCWAGPLLVVAARERDVLPAGLRDSKKLSAIARSKLQPHIIVACDIGEGWVTPAEIDALGLTEAMCLGVERALTAIKPLDDEEVIMDGDINYVARLPAFARLRSQAIIKADDSYPIVSAASIFAKVTRDRYMQQISRDYPAYGFDKHVGYGTAVHAAALRLEGVCDLHRLSFKPIRLIVEARA